METFNEIERKRLLAILGENRELCGLTCAKIYTAGKGEGYWLDSDLEGFLCFVLDRNENTRYIILYETDTYDKLFQVELYSEFNKHYNILSDKFHCFEMNSGFIGIKFENSKEAEKFVESIKKLADEKKMLNSNRKYIKSGEIVEILKKKLSVKLSKSKAKFKNEYCGDDGIEICKPKHFSLLSNIKYDKNKNKFVIGDIPQDLKRLFKLIGIKKSDFNDTGYALNIFKILIQAFETLQSEKKDKTVKLYKIDGKSLSFKDRINNSKLKLSQKATILDYRYSISSVLSNEDESKKTSQKSSTKINVPPTIPTIPMMVPKILVPILINKIDLTSPSTNANEIKMSPEKELENLKNKSIISNSDSNQKSSNLIDLMSNVKLKPVDNRPLKINQNDQSVIKDSNILQLAIKQRREKLTQNDVNSDDSENEWSDDD